MHGQKNIKLPVLLHTNNVMSYIYTKITCLQRIFSFFKLRSLFIVEMESTDLSLRVFFYTYDKKPYSSATSFHNSVICITQTYYRM